MGMIYLIDIPGERTKLILITEDVFQDPEDAVKAALHDVGWYGVEDARILSSGTVDGLEGGAGTYTLS